MGDRAEARTRAALTAALNTARYERDEALDREEAERERAERAEAERDALGLGLEEIALFHDGKRIDNQADLLREKARIVLSDSVTRRAFDGGLIAEIEEMWGYYCDGDLSLGALAQELGAALSARARGPGK